MKSTQFKKSLFLIGLIFISFINIAGQIKAEMYDVGIGKSWTIEISTDALTYKYSFQVSTVNADNVEATVRQIFPDGGYIESRGFSLISFNFVYSREYIINDIAPKAPLENITYGGRIIECYNITHPSSFIVGFLVVENNTGIVVEEYIVSYTGFYYLELYPQHPTHLTLVSWDFEIGTYIKGEFENCIFLILIITYFAVVFLIALFISVKRVKLRKFIIENKENLSRKFLIMNRIHEKVREKPKTTFILLVIYFLLFLFIPILMYLFGSFQYLPDKLINIIQLIIFLLSTFLVSFMFYRLRKKLILDEIQKVKTR
jgi:hypothetical protein